MCSVNSGSEQLKWDLLRVPELALLFRVNTEVRSRTFGGVEKISGYEEGKKLLIY